MTPEQYLAGVDLSNTPRPLVEMDAAQEPNAAVFEQARTQAQVVGSGVFSFAQGVDVGVREAVSDSMLLAQLVANKQSGTAETNPLQWFTSYTSALQHLGWMLTTGGWTDYTSEGTAADVHHEILAVLTSALGPSPAALAVVVASVNALRAMNPESSWIRIFSRESQRANIARLQIGIVEQDAGAISMSMLACLIEAETSISQVLLFKFRQARASFRANHSRFTASGTSLIALQPKIQAKVQAYQSAYVSSIADL